MPSIPDPYLATFLGLRSGFIDLDGDPAEFDDLFSTASDLTLSQNILCRRIFRRTFDLWSEGVMTEDISRIVATLDSIPKFSKYEKEETACMILRMVSVLPAKSLSR